MPESPKFPKPARSALERGDGVSFINRTQETANNHAPAPDVHSLPRRRKPEPKAMVGYKHKANNHRHLKKLSQALDIPMGDLLDEALESKFAEWEALRNSLPSESYLSS